MISLAELVIRKTPRIRRGQASGLDFPGYQVQRALISFPIFSSNINYRSTRRNTSNSPQNNPSNQQTWPAARERVLVAKLPAQRTLARNRKRVIVQKLVCRYVVEQAMQRVWLAEVSTTTVFYSLWKVECCEDSGAKMRMRSGRVALA